MCPPHSRDVDMGNAQISRYSSLVFWTSEGEHKLSMLLVKDPPLRRFSSSIIGVNKFHRLSEMDI